LTGGQAFAVVNFFDRNASGGLTSSALSIQCIKEDIPMLVLSRQENQTIVFPNLGIKVEVLRVKGKNVRIGIDAPDSIRVLRGELETEDSHCQASSVFGKLDAQLSSLDLESQHQVRNDLNTASLSVHLAQKHIERGGSEAVDELLREALNALQKLNRSVEALMRTNESDSKVAADPTSSTPTENWLLNKTALIVEDNDNERELLAGVLEMAGCHVIAVADGQAALEFLELHEKPDVVLMDMNMPRLDGAQTVSKIRSELNTEQLPIFGVSGLNQAEANLPVGDRGVTGWFSKPVNPNQLVKYLRHEIEGMNESTVN
jgi:carbon storage regulator CsrA